MTNWLRVLLVEDDIGLLKLYELILSHADFDVKQATSGNHALDVLQDFAPDIIVSDLMMPGMDGVELCQQIRKSSQWQDIPFLVLTASNDKTLLREILESGATRIVNKPIRPVTLAQIVREVAGTGGHAASNGSGSMKEAANF